MIENAETFRLLAEVAVVVAGFAGVATVFVGQDRPYQAAENLRLRALFQNSALVLVGCLGLLAMDAAGVSRKWSILSISLVTALIYLATLFDVPLKAVKLRAKDGSSVTIYSLIVAYSPFAICVPILGLTPFIQNRNGRYCLFFRTRY